MEEPPKRIATIGSAACAFGIMAALGMGFAPLGVFKSAPRRQLGNSLADREARDAAAKKRARKNQKRLAAK